MEKLVQRTNTLALKSQCAIIKFQLTISSYLDADDLFSYQKVAK